MSKTAAIYDKWLHTLGGGEMIACTMAKILKDHGYEVFFLSGSKVPVSVLKNRLGIDLNEVKFANIWCDEARIKKFSQGKDLFVNLSFMDYSFCRAKKNIYYTHFPTKLYDSFKGFLAQNYIYPILSKFIKSAELLTKNKGIAILNNSIGYRLNKNITVAYSYLTVNKEYLIKFSVFFETFYKGIFKTIDYEVEQAKIIEKKIAVDHHHNVVHYATRLKSQSSTIYLNVRSESESRYSGPGKDIFLIHPRIFPTLPLTNYFYKRFYERINEKMRTGMFVDVKKRIASYNLILANSLFTKQYIEKYWKRRTSLLYPPVELIFKKYGMRTIAKKKWITSVGRFFTFGHGKKQEVLISAFIKLYEKGYKDWQLHFVGGASDDLSSIQFVTNLKKIAQGYPIYFHLNVNRQEIDKILIQSKIYWHATGYGENEKSNPVKFEHFGIAPIEAISAKCVPILYNGGGLKEIVSLLKLNKKRNLFSTVDQLVGNTIFYIKNDKILSWQKIFKLLEKNFSIETFRKSFLKIINS